MVLTVRTQVKTRGQGDAADLTSVLAKAVGDSGLARGVATIFVVGSTAGVTTIEYEQGVVADLDGALARVAPRDADYEHHRRWGDDNGSSHVRAAIVGPSLTVPFVDRSPVLGTWQQVVVVEFDTRPRTRELVIQVIGE